MPYKVVNEARSFELLRNHGRGPPWAIESRYSGLPVGGDAHPGPCDAVAIGEREASRLTSREAQCDPAYALAIRECEPDRLVPQQSERRPGASLPVDQRNTRRP